MIRLEGRHGEFFVDPQHVTALIPFLTPDNIQATAIWVGNAAVGIALGRPDAVHAKLFAAPAAEDVPPERTASAEEAFGGAQNR